MAAHHRLLLLATCASFLGAFPAHATTTGGDENVHAPVDDAPNHEIAAMPHDEAISATQVSTDETEDEDGWTIAPRGRLQFDFGTVDAPDPLGRADGFDAEVRRARLGFQGQMPGGFGYKVEADFAGSSVELADAILTYEADGLIATIGHHNNFQGLEELTSSLNISMLERAAYTDAFGFERRLGTSLQFQSDAVLLQGGVFLDNINDLSTDNWSADGRVVYMPKSEAGQFHLGASVHYTDFEDDSSVRYRQRPFVHLTDERLVNTGQIDAAREFGFGLESAFISGPFHIVAEGFRQSVDRIEGVAGTTFHGAYGEIGYFLTKGDSRGYKGGKFDRIKPENPVGSGGIGAVQIVARYDYLDLNDADVVGGKQNAYGASLIWTPTSYTRLIASYNRLQYDDAVHPLPDGTTSYDVDAFGIRAQVDF
ncbi:MAG: hypothetical protein DI637_00190 [Citromicrobium sp.]|nr:MAG: hypothetical protein DI637_00190 [Citromicrobium sp.]